tara:strand:- start:255 stop:710 length:456 start_codon:yes stop_codon:yes gene_type:complete
MSEVLFTNPISASTKLGELIKLGLLSEADIQKFNNKLTRGADRAARKALLEGTMSAIKALVASEAHDGNRYWSVKPAAHSLGFMTYIEADRGIILKALTKLTEEGFLTKVGLKKVDGKLTELDKSQVNAFQLRYIVTPVEEADAAADEAAE